MKIHIIKHGWLRQKYHSVIKAANGRILYSSEPQFNLEDLEEMIARNFPRIEVVYDFER